MQMMRQAIIAALMSLMRDVACAEKPSKQNVLEDAHENLPAGDEQDDAEAISNRVLIGIRREQTKSFPHATGMFTQAFRLDGSSRRGGGIALRRRRRKGSYSRFYQLRN